jgi:predicted acyltransferase
VSAELTTKNTADLTFTGADRLTGVVGPGLNLANYIDQRYLPGRKYDGTWDPEGLLSTLPAVATCLLGVLAGLLLRTGAVAPRRKVAWLVGAGAVLAGLGWLWGLQFPVIKKIWTSSYVLVAGGYSAILLGVFYQAIEIWNRRTWAAPFVWIGSNAITIYMAAGIVDFRGLARRFAGGNVEQFADRAVTPGAGRLLISALAVGLIVLLARFLYRRQIFLRV